MDGASGAAPRALAFQTLLQNPGAKVSLRDGEFVVHLPADTKAHKSLQVLAALKRNVNAMRGKGYDVCDAKDGTKRIRLSPGARLSEAQKATNARANTEVAAAFVRQMARNCQPGSN